MAAGLVIGICSNSDTKALDDALSAQQIDLDKVKVFASDGDDLEATPLDFIEVFRDTESITGLSDDMTRGTGVLADSGGTSVPGLGGREPRFKAFFPEEGESKHYLDGFPVPDDEVENFDDAIAEGHAVVLYPDAGADASKIASAFKAAGLLNVRSF
ncbi:MAG TPA: hypothetical protein VKR56_14765 [Candidatus Cybelea sp.]|nr:hypothetical protein [Candidatus Cybelea sp.]